MTACTASQIENRADIPPLQTPGNQIDDALGFRLVAVLIDPEIVDSEPFLEPVRLF
jgi:hypothetical protein